MLVLIADYEINNVLVSASALIERKRRKRKLDKEVSKNEFVSESIGEEAKTPLSCIITTNVESSIEKVM